MVCGRGSADEPEAEPAISPASERIAGRFRQALAADLSAVPQTDPMLPFWTDLLAALEALGTTIP